MTRLRPLITLVLLTLLTFPAGAHALRCDGGLVSEGDQKFEVLRRCGQPYYVDAWQEPYFYGYAPSVGYMEDWYYNFGPSHLIRILRLRNGRLVDIMTGAYGFNGPALPPPRDPRFPDYNYTLPGR